jgi:hypothetical protein
MVSAQHVCSGFLHEVSSLPVSILVALERITWEYPPLIPVTQVSHHRGSLFNSVEGMSKRFASIYKTLLAYLPLVNPKWHIFKKFFRSFGRPLPAPESTLQLPPGQS